MGFEPPGHRKSDSLMKNDSFWWGRRVRTSNMGFFHCWSEVSGLGSRVSGLRSQVSGLKVFIGGPALAGLNSSIYTYGNQISGGLHPKSLVVGVSGGHYFDFKGFLIDIIESSVFPACPIWPIQRKCVLFKGFEPPGHRKSDSLMKHESFWWGERLWTSKMRLFHHNKWFYNTLL